MRIAFVAILASFLSLQPVWANDQITIDRFLVIDRVGRSGRSPVFIDPIELMRVTGRWKTPAAGGVVKAADGREVAWREARAGEDGWISGEKQVGGYALATVSVDADRIMILEAAGHGMVFVNGEPRAGDPYEYGFVRLPVLLKRGSNELLFTIARGRLRAKLFDPPAELHIEKDDLTAPDFIRSRSDRQSMGVLVVNATNRTASDVALEVGDGAHSGVMIPRIPPLGRWKVGLAAHYRGENVDELPLDLRLRIKDRIVHTTKVRLRVRQQGQTHRRSFHSDIDGSTQYYAVTPSTAAREKARKPAMILSLHGAAVEATSQADAYTSKSWAEIVCPTNRRPFGFDWEDWGRIDALEALADAQDRLQTDSSRVYLTGHSMGGHGTWSIGSLFPDRFAAIGPSAGWISFSTYGTTRPATQPADPIVEIMRRAASPSETSHVFPNLAHLGVYILHGADDDNVPADQARQMVGHLSKFHKNFVYHEQPEAGHWWDSSDEPGAECVDWAPMFDFFARHRLPAAIELRQIDFTTPSPGVSSRCHWITIEAQQRAMQPSSVSIRVDPGKNRYTGTTTNVARLAIDPIHIKRDEPIEIDLDGQKLTMQYVHELRIWLERTGATWRVIGKPSPALKGPHRGGPFKDAFRNRMAFVYGTQGTPEENDWALAKARFDAETWWYRGNGSVELIPDVELNLQDADRNIILYGNADTISCWGVLLGDSPVQIQRGRVIVGSREETGGYLACLLVRPRLGSDRASVAVIGGTGIVGMRLTDRLPVFVSGVAYPDVTLLDPEVLEEGTRAIRAAGFFGNDWSVENGEFVWNPVARATSP